MKFRLTLVLLIVAVVPLLTGCALTGDAWYHPYGPTYGMSAEEYDDQDDN